MSTTLRKSRLSTRTLLVGLVLITLSGCASTMDELVAEAVETGDWTAVNARQDAQAAGRQLSCGARQILHCETILNRTSCGCVANTTFWDQPATMTHRQRGDRY